jgi:hypothetical protein
MDKSECVVGGEIAQVGEGTAATMARKRNAEPPDDGSTRGQEVSRRTGFVKRDRNAA